MIKRILVTAVAAAAAAGFGCKAKPCTKCLDVSGTYSEFAQGEIPCGFDNLDWQDGLRTIHVVQDGSQLVLKDFAAVDMTGTLLDNGTATFGPLNLEVSGYPTQGSLTLSGRFENAASMTFTGSYAAKIPAQEGCNWNLSTTWTRADDGVIHRANEVVVQLRTNEITSGMSSPVQLLVTQEGSTSDKSLQGRMESSDSSVASVYCSNACVVNGVKPGHATITGRYGELSGQAEVVVVEPSLKSFTASASKTTLLLFEKATLNAIGLPTGGGAATNVNRFVTWSSSSAIVSIDEHDPAAPAIKANNAGTATVTATLGTYSSTIDFTVVAGTALSLSAQPTSVTVDRGQTAQLKLLGQETTQTNTHDVTTKATWRVRDQAIASVTSTGVVKGLGNGSTVVTGTFAPLSVDIPVTVRVVPGPNWAQNYANGFDVKLSASAMVFDPGIQKSVLFGGGVTTTTGEVLAAFTMEFDGARWTDAAPASSPSARKYHAMAYDSARHVAVLFGGYGTTLMDDTWEWDGQNWAQRTPQTRPPARMQGQMAYDAERGVTVLFGGQNSQNGQNRFLGDTWLWDGNDWSQQSPAVSPDMRTGHAMAYDATRKKVVLFGGYASDRISYNQDTWTWNGVTWAEASPATTPPAMALMTLTFDAARSRTVLVGGFAGDSHWNADTWEWDGANWIRMTPVDTPGTRVWHVAAYDAVRQRVVLYGGYGRVGSQTTWRQDLWEY